ncbi:uncharacterized protein B0I36DRAFT_89513 [Microdochium trichocladiopsis]|uniref:Nucleotide exchange factor SIL1 n=1 Tax=Microdochium trichocladiopsis TaxID=1682393 RepID=A0A9P9BT77_9PEZI|nr:uncharacterized protein B0I36DRAFT_89513 [Microdochium trichocladiopsis]KAH7035207.1 hypothetical protein B0I36DRAFT_89513 [Microdochium trichocladiopsis]
MLSLTRPQRRRAVTTISTFSLAFLVLLISSPLAGAGAAPAAPPPPASQQSPSADSPDLICHTENPAECYPRIFSATHEFQVVHDDQDLPPGLHVQLDMQTGQKVAKIYNPNEQDDPALEGLPVDHSVVLVDQHPDSEAADNSRQAGPRPGAPAYEPHGVIKEPREQNTEFAHSRSIVKDHVALPDGVEAGTLVPALAELEDLSHDMYYGLKISEDADLVQALFCILLERDMDAYHTTMEQTSDASKTGMEERPDFLASSILAAAIRNNPASLAALEKSWAAGGLMDRSCRLQPVSLKDTLYDNLAPSSLSSSSSMSTAQSRFESDQTRLTLAVLRGLLKSPVIRDEFLASGGMRQFLQILLTPDEAWAARKDKVARIVADTFLDTDAGAVTGVWPRNDEGGSSSSTAAAATPDVVCGTAAQSGAGWDDGSCWDHHLKTVIKNGQGGDWAKDLLALLQAARAPQTPEEAKQEL